MIGPITTFGGPHQYLSNMYPCLIVISHPLILGGSTVSAMSTEAIYQAAKTGSKSLLTMSGYLAKRVSRNFQEHPSWKNEREEVMTALIDVKFDIPELRLKLIETENCMIVEGNTWHDNFWGNCICSHCSRTPGRNRLGEILMAKRKRLRQEMNGISPRSPVESTAESPS